MVSGIGIDMIDTQRVLDRVTGDSGFREYVFHPNEIAYCERMAKKEQHYGARFSAKEALMKALGTGFLSGLAMNEIEVINDPNGKPGFVFHGETKTRIEAQNLGAIHLTLSHLETIACAMVVLEMK